MFLNFNNNLRFKKLETIYYLYVESHYVEPKTLSRFYYPYVELSFLSRFYSLYDEFIYHAFITFMSSLIISY